MDPSLDSKQQYGELKRRLRQLIAENEIYKQEIAKVNDRLLRVTRDKAFLLDQLLPYEDDDSSTESELSDSDQDSHHPIPPQPQPHTPSTPRRSQTLPVGAGGSEKNNRGSSANAAEKATPTARKPRPPRPRKPRNPPAGVGEQGGSGRPSGGGAGGSGKGAAARNTETMGPGNTAAGAKRSLGGSGPQENHYLSGPGGQGHQKGFASQKEGGASYGTGGERPLLPAGGGRRSSGGGGGQRKKARLEQQAAALAGQSALPVQARQPHHQNAKAAARHRNSHSLNSHQTSPIQPGQGGLNHPTSSGIRKSGNHAAALTLSSPTAGIPAGAASLDASHDGSAILPSSVNLHINHGHAGSHVNSVGQMATPATMAAVAARPTNPLTAEELERHLAAKQGARKIQALPQPASLTLPAELFNEDAFLGDFAAEQVV